MAGDFALQPVSSGAPSLATDEAVTLLLRVWSTEAAPLHWNAAPRWMAMLRVTVVSSGGTLPHLEASENALLRVNFPSAMSAIRASRRLHALVSGYAAESKGQLFGVAILIVPGTVIDGALIRYLGQKARPAQTLLAAKRGAVQPEGRRVDDAFFGELTLYELSYAHEREAAETAGTLLREHKERPAMPKPAPAPSSSSYLPSRSRNMTVVRVAYLAAFVAALLALAAGVAIARRPVKTSMPASPVKTQTVQTPVTSQPQPVPGPPPVGKTPPAPPPTKVDHVKKKPLPPKPTEAADIPIRGRGDLTYEQIRQILTRGQNALDRGCYTEAIRYYRRVLDDDPRNGSAVSGQEKARVRMRLSGENAQCSR